MTDHSFARAWCTVAELAPDRVALVCGDRRSTFAEFEQRARSLARVLAGAGIGPGDKVAIMCVNSPEYMEAFFAAQLLGAVPVNVNYRYVGAELAYLLDNSDAAALVYHDEFAATVADALGTHEPETRPRVLLQVAHDGDGIAARRRPGLRNRARATSPTDQSCRRTNRPATTSSSSTPAVPPAFPKP